MPDDESEAVEDTEEAEGRAEKVDLNKIDEDLTNTVTDFLTNSLSFKASTAHD